MYDDKLKRMRTFTITYGPDGIGSYKVQARSSLEAGANFMQEKPRETMFNIKGK